MNADAAFLIANAVGIWGWIALLLSPLIPKWSHRIAAFVIPVLLCISYVFILGYVVVSGGLQGGYLTLDDVMALFSVREVVLAGWLHVMAFDLFVGAWIVRNARETGVSFWWVLLVLPLAFIAGPAGFVLYLAIRSFAGKRGLEPGEQASPGAV